MQYGEQLCEIDEMTNEIYKLGIKNLNTPICDLNYTRYVGWQEDNECIKKFFSKKTVKIISCKVTELLMGVDEQNRKIIIPNNRICEVMSSVQAAYLPETGDIYTIYNIAKGDAYNDNNVQRMIDQTIEIIVSDVKVNLGMEQNNAKLSIWTTVLGDFNPHNLRAHSQIKIRNKRPNPMEFHMHY
jgi:hypothetical protein